MGSTDPFDWLPEELNCYGLCLRVTDKQRWLTGRGYDGRFDRVES